MCTELSEKRGIPNLYEAPETSPNLDSIYPNRRTIDVQQIQTYQGRILLLRC
jgi:hypothetical protein